MKHSQALFLCHPRVASSPTPQVQAALQWYWFHHLERAMYDTERSYGTQSIIAAITVT